MKFPRVSSCPHEALRGRDWRRRVALSTAAACSLASQNTDNTLREALSHSLVVVLKRRVMHGTGIIAAMTQR